MWGLAVLTVMLFKGQLCMLPRKIGSDTVCYTLTAMIAKLHGTVEAHSWYASLLCQVIEGFLEKMMFRLRPEE